MNKLYILSILIGVAIAIKEIINFKTSNTEKKSFQKLPYKKKNIMTDPELSFFRVLEKKYSTQYYIIPQVVLSSIIDVDLPKKFFAYKGYRSKIDKKTIDFVLFSKDTFKPFMAIELDESSHSLPDRKERDEFVNPLFEKVGIKLKRVMVANSYNIDNLLE